jgi:hypothetical protein
MSFKITKHTPAEDLINSSPKVLDYLVRKGICGIRFKLPLSGTLEQMAMEKNFSESEIETTLAGLNNILEQPK